MRLLTATTRRRKTVSRFLLAALWFSLLIGPRVPSSTAQQTTEHAHELLTLSTTQNRTDHQQALQTAEEALAIFTALGDQTGITQA